MKTFVTGATGLVGNGVVKLLLAEGHAVRALVRDPEKARATLPPEVELVAGDVTDPASLERASLRADWLFHCAGIPEVWSSDRSAYDRVNRVGTRNVLAAALQSGVQRTVVTSTMDVFAAPVGGRLDETQPDPKPKRSAYERSKQLAEIEADEARVRGLDVVLVNPAAVYGPSPVNAALNSMVIRLLNGATPALPPGGVSVAYVEGIARAHLAAAERGRSGERYLIADEFVTHRAFAEEVLRHSDGRRVPLTAPKPLLEAMTFFLEPLARLFRFTPLLTRDQLHFLTWSAQVDASKAQRELGFQPTPLRDGIASTVAALRAQGLVR